MKESRLLISQERLREVLYYNPRTGLFFRRLATCNRVKVGDIVGSPDANGYLRVFIDGRFYLLHRLAWFWVHKVWPEGLIDHRDGNVSNNRIRNLRDASASVNGQNIREAPGHSVSGLLGAQWWAYRNTWASTIVVNRKQIYLGKFDSAKAAHEAYMAAKRKYHEGSTL